MNLTRRFSPGRLVATPGVLAAISRHELFAAYYRHLRCDWGIVCAEDKRLNDAALKCGEQLLSAYQTADGVKFWIITKADRTATTVLLPQEY